MTELHPQFISDGEVTRFVVLPFAEWELLRAMLEDARDLRDLRAAKQEDEGASALSLTQIRTELGLETS